jgi:hypothetical protein
MPRQPRAVPPAVGINPHIPVEVQRDLRKVANTANTAQSRADDALAGVANSVQKTPADLQSVADFVNQQFGDRFLLNIPGAPGAGGLIVTSVGGRLVVSLPEIGPGPGTYATGAKITGGGSPGSITLDAYGRVVGISPAT